MVDTSKGSFLTVKCHERPITDIKFNADGDLLFTCAKDSNATLLRPDGTIVGAYNGHDGSIFTLSVDEDSTHFLTGSADQSIIHWDVERGSILHRIDLDSVVKGSDFLKGSQNCLVVTDDLMNKTPQIFLYDTRKKKAEIILTPQTTPTKIVGDYTGHGAVYSDLEGGVHKIDLRNIKNKDCTEGKNGENSAKIHSSKITNLRTSFCKTFFISSSTDSQAKIIDIDTLENIKTFVTEEPVNCSVIFPSNDRVITVGGIDARDVTTSKGKGSFDTNFFDIVTTEKIGCYTTHFGTINSVDVHPSGRIYSTGGEEGTINILEFGDDFYASGFTNFE